MLYFHKQGLVLLCQPKTGTTSLHEALSEDASVAVRTPPNAKHMTFATFMDRIAPLMATSRKVDRSKLTVVSIMREPIDWFGSWYRYNAREELSRPKSKRFAKYTGNISFDTYLNGLLLPKKEAPEYARLGGPCSVSLDREGFVGVDRLFRYTDIDAMVDFVGATLGKSLQLPKANVSGGRTLDAGEETLAKIKQRFAADFQIYDNLKGDGSVDAVRGICAKRR